MAAEMLTLHLLFRNHQHSTRLCKARKRLKNQYHREGNDNSQPEESHKGGYLSVKPTVHSPLYPTVRFHTTAPSDPSHLSLSVKHANQPLPADIFATVPARLPAEANKQVRRRTCLAGLCHFSKESVSRETADT